jgi:fatty acid metabolism transcriptional regulator FadR
MFEPIDKSTVPEQVAATIRQAIVSGELQAGDALPSERALAEELGVNRSTVREALHRLEAWGLVRIRQGGATVVEDILVTAGLHLLPFLIAPGGEPDVDILDDLLALRVELLRWTAEQAAERNSDTRTLRDLVDEMERAHDAPALQLLDFEFFEELVRLSSNRVLRLLANAIRRVYVEHRELFSLLYAGFETTEHRKAVDAIAAGDARAAGAAMQAYAREALDVIRFSQGES